MKNRWLRLRIRTPCSSVGAVVAELWSLGTTGVEHQTSTADSNLLDAYFDISSMPPDAATDPQGGYWRECGAELERVDHIADRDWLSDFRARARIFELGRRFLVDPREPGSEAAEADGRTLLKLPARLAFGTGSHESTRLVVEWLERQQLVGRHVLDVGTGTGILSFAALDLGASWVVAVEIDVAATFMAHLNQGLNRASFPLIAGSVDALGPPAGFDLILVNVLPRRIVDHLGQIARLLRPRGDVIFSGILGKSLSEVEDRIADLGLAVRERTRSGDWWAVVAEREGE